MTSHIIKIERNDYMKIIFLDIDGVLNTFRDKELINNIFEKKKLERLIKLSNETHSKIIITSDRRIHFDERLLIDEAFDRYNALIDYLSYKVLYRNRSDEIIYYLNHNQNITNYVILDDNDLGFSQNQELSNHFINTYKNGFGNTEYNLAKNILK